MTKILLGIPLFSLLSLVYARIGIGTIEVTANTQQVLDVPDQTAKLLRLHRPSRVTSCPTDFVYRTLWQSLIEVSRLNGLALTKQLTVLLRCSLFQLKRLNRYDYTDQAGSPVVQQTFYTVRYGNP